MTMQTVTLDFTGKIAGSTVENKNVAYMNGVEFTQTQYDLIFGSELRVTTTDELSFEFPLPPNTVTGLQYTTIYFKSKMDSGEVELRSSDKGVYNANTTLYQQKLLEVYIGDIVNDTVMFNMKSTGNYGTYEVKIDVLYDDAGLNSYGGQYVWNNSGSSVTVPIQNKKLEEIITELESKPVNSITNVTFAQIGTEIVTP